MASTTEKQRGFSSFRAAGRALGVSHTTVIEWTKREDWPFPTSPETWVKDDIEAWADDLQEDRNDDRSDRSTIALKDSFPITPANLLDEKCPFRLSKYLHPSLIADLTGADLKELAEGFMIAMWLACNDIAVARGEQGLQKRGTFAYYDRLITEAIPNGFQTRWWDVFTCYLAARFKGRSWWKETYLDIDPTKEFHAWEKTIKPLSGKVSNSKGSQQ